MKVFFAIINSHYDREEGVYFCAGFIFEAHDFIFLIIFPYRHPPSFLPIPQTLPWLHPSNFRALSDFPCSVNSSAGEHFETRINLDVFSPNR